MNKAPSILTEDLERKTYYIYAMNGQEPLSIGNGMQSNTTMLIKVYLMVTLDNYMFRPLLAIFSLSSRELKVERVYSQTQLCQLRCI
jgi:hypothetical protein